MEIMNYEKFKIKKHTDVDLKKKSLNTMFRATRGCCLKKVKVKVFRVVFYLHSKLQWRRELTPTEIKYYFPFQAVKLWENYLSVCGNGQESEMVSVSDRRRIQFLYEQASWAILKSWEVEKWNNNNKIK